NPQLAEAWFNKGMALYYQGKYEEAISSLDEVIKINPKLEQARYSKALA
ncbi:MAG: Tetratricopeptide repeat, partial [Methanomicrobia archaeon]|nr:Tetratricopeptide repeat [Methanomicrobia archaeon]